MIYRFTLFARHAGQEAPPASLCVLQDLAMVAAVEAVLRGKGKDVLGRYRVRHLEGLDEDHAHCELVYVASKDVAEQRRALAVLARQSVLTVGESKAFVEAGGVIGFYLEDDRVRFAINPRAAEVAGFRLSSRLLQLAIVTGSAESKPEEAHP